MKRRMSNESGAFALPAVVVVSVLILLLILFAYSALSLDMQRYSLYHGMKQAREDLKSAMMLYCVDSTLCPVSDSAKVELFSGHDVVDVSVSRFGLYEKAVFSNSYPDRYEVLLGKRFEGVERAAFWLCDRHRALSLAGDSRIDGLVYMPLSGINYTDVNGNYYSGEKIPESLLRVSSMELPAADSAQSAYAGRLCSMCVDKVELHNNLRDTIVCGSVVRIKSGFGGSLQVFASDTVIVESGAVLEYPSGIYVDSGENRPFVLLSEGAKLGGYVIVTSRNSDSQLRYPSYVQKKGSALDGFLYVNGSCNLEGDIRGAAYVKDCYYCSNGNVYAGTLYDVRISGSDSLAFPIFLTGPYRRKQVKQMH